MKLDRSRIVWGVLLIAAGVMFMLQELNILGNAFQYLWVLLTLAGGGVFLWIFITRKDQWWAIIPGLALAGIALVTLEDILNLFPGSDWTGSIFLGCIGLAFWLVYFRDRNQWWAIIPGGVLVTLALVSGLDMWTDVAFFLGLAVTFGLVAVLPNQTHDTRWALIPAGILFVLGIVLFAPFQSILNILWPLALIGLGIFIMIKTWK